MPSSFGYQPRPIKPDDFDEFLAYQRNLNSIIRDKLHGAGTLARSPPIKPTEIKTRKKKSSKK